MTHKCCNLRKFETQLSWIGQFSLLEYYNNDIDYYIDNVIDHYPFGVVLILVLIDNHSILTESCNSIIIIIKLS